MAKVKTRIITPTQVGLFGAKQGDMPFRVMMKLNPGTAGSALVDTLAFGNQAFAGFGIAAGPTKEKLIDITPFVSNLGWNASDGEFYTTLNVTLDNTGGIFNQMPLAVQVQLQVRSPFYSSGKTGGAVKWYTTIVAYSMEKDRAADSTNKTMTLTCYDKLYWLAQTDYHGVFKVNKNRPKGWTATQIITVIAAKLGVKVGHIDASAALIKRVEPKGTALECIQHVLALDKTATGRKRKYSINMRDGKLNVVLENPAPKSVWAITENILIENGSMSETAGDKFATQLVVTGNIASHKKTAHGSKVKTIKAVTVTVNPADKTIQQIFGIISKTAKLKGTHSSKADIATKAQHLLAMAMVPKREFTISIHGIPNLWPGDRVYVESLYFGTKGILRITSVNYALQGGEFTLDLGVGVDTKTALTAAQMSLYYSKQQVRY